MEYQRESYGPSLAALQRDDARITVRFGDAYESDFTQLAWTTAGPLLIIGNPPWVTTAALGRLDGTAPQPVRSNPNRLRGLDARTGSANFDVAEFLLLKILGEFATADMTLAVLIKESVARKVVAAHVASGGALRSEIVRIDARKWFGVAVDACCLIMSPQGPPMSRVPIRESFSGAPVAWFDPTPLPAAPDTTIVWRQGIKHDAAAVFELTNGDGGALRNGFGDVVDVEPEYVYPFYKARAVQFGMTDRMALIVPQQRLNEPTAPLALRAPRLHAYFGRYRAQLDGRKSSIYRSAPPFSIFGIGAYSFAPWKVAVAGLYIDPNFAVLGPVDGRPVMLGDTSYFAGFENEALARQFAAHCASVRVRAQLEGRIVRGKRPITKRVLMSIDWADAGRLTPLAGRSGAP
jgi:hypothetical protein